MSAVPTVPHRAPRVPVWYNPTIRGIVYQVLLVGSVGFLLFEAARNARTNMQARGIPTDFGFWNNTSGFDISQSLIAYSAVSTYGRAFFVGLLNTLLVALLGIVFATIIGFVVGLARLSSNWIVAKFATVYVETIRNIPLLLQLLFLYNAVLRPLPAPRQSLSVFGLVFLNNRGLFMPEPVFGDNAVWIAAAAGLGLVASTLWWRAAKARRRRTGRRPIIWPVAVALVLGLPLLAFFALGRPVTMSLPELKGFNFTGGYRMLPEFATLLAGLSIYTASFIAEIVRAGILAVPQGQTEAAAALGLARRQTLKYIVVPQAMRVIIPPLTSQYLNLIKNSSLAVFVGYPDLVGVFAGTVLNQTGAAVQVIAITMAVYLAISLVLSLAMNLFNRRLALATR